MDETKIDAQLKKLKDTLTLPHHVASYKPDHFHDMNGYDYLFFCVEDVFLEDAHLSGDGTWQHRTTDTTLYYHIGDATIGSLFETIENPTLIYETYDSVEWASYLWLFTVHMWKYKDKHVMFKQSNIDDDYGGYSEYEIKVGEYDELMKDIDKEYILFNNKKIKIKNSDEKSKSKEN